MTDVLSRSFPAPKNWQDFERLTFDLFRRHWNSDDIELNGRAGQPQSGVDVCGTDYITGQDGSRFIGVQCKGKDSEYGHAVTERELRAEVEKALTFQPPLDLFVLATTAPNDVSIQAVARSITADHRKAGKFAVQVKGWDTLRQLITDFPEVVSKHFQDFAPFDLIGKIDQVRAENDVGFQQTFKMLTQHANLLGVNRDGEGESDPLAQAVTEIANQIGDGSPLAALKALQRMLRVHEMKASNLVRFRILANIGNAYVALGNETEAITAFTNAHAAYPEYPNARATLAVAKILEGDREEALRLAKSALADDPASQRAAGVIIDVMPPGTPIADVESALTVDVLEHFEVKIGLSLRAHREGDCDSALRFAQAAHRLKPDDWRALSGVAEALLSPLATLDVVTMTGVLDKQLEQTLDHAIELNRKAWKILAAQDSSYLGRHVAANLVSQLLLSGEQSEAWEVLDQALAHNPHYVPLLQRQAQRAAGNGEWESAREAIAKIPEADRGFEDAMMVMQCALRLEDANEAMAAISGLTALARLPEQSEFAAALTVQAQILGGGDAAATVEPVLDGHPQSIIVRSVLLDFFTEDGPLKARIVEETAALASGPMSDRSRIFAAEAMIDAGEFSRAADLYAPLHNRRDTSSLFRHLQALHWADRREEARRLYESLPAAVRLKERYVRLGIAIYEQAGLLKPAVRLLETSLVTHDRLADRLRWMQLLIRLGDTRHVGWLRSISTDIEGSARELTMLAQFVDKYLAGDGKALELGYRALRVGYSDPQVHLGFAFGLFFKGSARRGEVAAPVKVEPGSGIILVDDAGGDVLHYIIEPRDNPAAERGELAPDNAVAKELLGRVAGDTISVRNAGTGMKTYRIAEVQNGYVFAYQRTLRDFNRMFPGNPAFGSIHLDESKEPSERFEPVFALARERSEQARNLEELYDTGPMPLFMLARFSGSPLFDIWEALRIRPQKFFKVALGVEQEFATGRKAAMGGLVLVDPLVIYAWVRLGLAETILKLRSSLGVVQSSIDLLRQLHGEREDQRGQASGSMGWDGEHYHMIESSPVAIEQRIADADAAARLADKLVLVPAESSRMLPPDVAALLANAHPAFADTFLAGLRDGRALLTDDLGLRIMAQECGICCTWTQTFLQAHLRMGDILPAEYQNGLHALTASRYDFTQLGHGEILAELRQSGWTINDKLRRFAALMVLPNVDRESLSTVLSQLAIDSQFGDPKPMDLAAFHIAFVDALANLGAISEAESIYRRVLMKLEAGFLKLLAHRELRKKLLCSTQLTSVDLLVSELDERATAMARRTWERLVEGGLSLSPNKI